MAMALQPEHTLVRIRSAWTMHKSAAALFDLEGALLAAAGGNKRAALAENVPQLAVRIPDTIIKVQGAIGAFLGLAVAAPHATALGTAVVLGDFACQMLRKVTGHTVGLYRTPTCNFQTGLAWGGTPRQECTE